MCLERSHNDICNRFLEPVPMNDTRDEFGPSESDMEIDERVRYNLLLPNDEDESETGYISNMEDSDEDDNYTHSSTIHDLTNEINQNSYLPSVSNIWETNNTDQSSEDREFDLNIPQILLSMARVSQNLDTIISAHLVNSASRN
ncbi:uncharacterized protein LOC111041803 [Myzus persicae]|uniref:uncharacterized protein LOC111041803 n=1 Tax=Myzus persicae TaxID=13164 RepID=UPI000B93665E|nr:uncharacterized protein LOC111041803 [Myzus persicae]